ncbi:lipocalin family protein [Dactylosporangium sp. CA-139066]|uniref:lipocalin family protein n=1 Tax=Dactylosporangium sp. CA-139066 TaxID=3239930 RepID=UPI003D92250A
MDPSRQWQQPDPSGGYGRTPPGGYPPQPPYGQPQQPQYPPPQYPPQPQAPQPQYPPQQYPQPAQPQYPQQAPPYSAVPYATPYSAPPAYQAAPQSGPPVELGAPMVPQRRRNRWFAALIVSSVLLVVLVVAIVVVALNRGSSDPTPPVAASQGPVDSCLIGTWKQTTYQHIVDLTGTDVGTREKLTKIKFSGGGKVWEIRADGNAVEDDTKTVYSGKTDDGRNVTATWEGRTEWKLTTKDGVMSFAGGEATTVVTINVDGSPKGRIELQPNLDPSPYTCNGDIWRTSSKDNDDDFARYDREK